MGWIRGHPRNLMLLFFSLATLLTGGLYSFRDWQSAGATPLHSTLAIAALSVALAFVLLILVRIVWKVGLANARHGR